MSPGFVGSTVGALRVLALGVLLGPFPAAALPASPTTGTQAPPPGPAPARGGVRLLEAMEAGGPVLVGRVDEIERLDAHGYSAWIHVERALGAEEGATEPGTAVRLAWEELATGRPARFAHSERVLVCLERLGAASIWRQRIPDPSVRRQTAGIAMQGDAFLRDPAPGTLDLLHHYLSLSPDDRQTATGVGYLAALVARAQLPLAEDAARRLAGMQDAGGRLAGEGDALIVQALQRGDAGGGLEAALLDVVRVSATPSMAKALRAATRAPGTPPARLFEALAIAAAGLSPSEVSRLLASDEPAYRLVVARTLTGPRAATTLTKLLASDPSPQVRAGAVRGLARVEAGAALPRVLAALCDPDAGVRSAAAAAAAAMGDAAVPGLVKVVFGGAERGGTEPGGSVPAGDEAGQRPACPGSKDAARAALDALSRGGPTSRKALVDIAARHPDASLRKLAGVALGELDAHLH